ncbi:hypothetical protein GWI33_007522 [Rhynchophorus ferrugineus]|uniref:Uncharacterized protein n=1 Tax=Rhynchophorus ferrugineus TaxID=354439 RepID=A0A834IEA5_RHYFE|nr:hypothetical protein GWI33_007522 [Rhynchophorus ferrugineus]
MRPDPSAPERLAFRCRLTPFAPPTRYNASRITDRWYSPGGGTRLGRGRVTGRVTEVDASAKTDLDPPGINRR